MNKTCIRHKYTVCSIPWSFIPHINLLPSTIYIPRAHKRHCKCHRNRTSQWSINPKWANGQWEVCLICVLPGTLAEIDDKIYDFKFYQSTHLAADFFSLAFFSIWTFSLYLVYCNISIFKRNSIMSIMRKTPFWMIIANPSNMRLSRRRAHNFIS